MASLDRPVTNGNGHIQDVDLEGLEYDPLQLEMMNEELIVVDYDDKPIGKESKKKCHLMANILPPQSMLHRAFSVFLFRPSDGRLLMQKRAHEKITFPDMWTNTCCSHPLAVRQEMVEEGTLGVRRAAQRKLHHELGIQNAQVPLDAFVYITRIHYLALSSGIWGEHEGESSSLIDYILFATADVTIEPNPNEVSDTCWVSKPELEVMFRQEGNSFTPWFRLIAESFLHKWWDSLVDRSTNEEIPSTTAGVKADAGVLRELITDKDRNEIHRMVKDSVQATIDESRSTRSVNGSL
ncbi:MAG: isopentenyl-diphosphate delta-isomerase idi1 [Cyphobasidiales sp. Tagirdzhanova-0007]|nr:MAG: isopentenyl-diphosphate delta-isomerase idi1 [Cyphobasidiales sp. Tagirdzhanova-0007]